MQILKAVQIKIGGANSQRHQLFAEKDDVRNGVENVTVNMAFIFVSCSN